MLVGERLSEGQPGAAETRPRHEAGRWGFGHVPALDGLRGAAVVAVLLYHGGYLDGGYLGVDLFFVLSGYLITSLLLSEHAATGAIDLRTFWTRRIRRLLPALCLLLVGIAVYAQVVARAVDLGTIRGDGLATLFYVANWHTILRGVSYWDISLAPSSLQHTWSLAIEEQFYLLWPLVVVAIARKARSATPRVLATVCLVGAALSAVLFVTLPIVGMSRTRVYEGTDTRAAALLLGAAWAALKKQGWQPTRHLVALGLGAAGLLAGAWALLDGESAWLYRGGLPLCSLLAVLVVMAVTAEPTRTIPLLGPLLTWGPLRWIGLISYGLYLWHWPVYVYLDEDRAGADGPELLALRLAVSLVVAVASYLLVEMPIRRGAVLRGRLGALSIPTGIATAAVLVLVTTSGAVSSQQDQMEAWGSPPVTVPGAPRMMIVGDSVGFSATRLIFADPRAYPVNVIGRAWIGCSLMSGEYPIRNRDGREMTVPPTECGHKFPLWMERDHPDFVLMMFGAGPMWQVEIDGRWAGPCDAAFDRAFVEVHTRGLRDLALDGTEVAVMTVPYRDPATDRTYAPELNGLVDCANAGLAAAVAQVPGTFLVDVNPLICPDGACVTQLDGADVRFDGLHLTLGPGGAAVVHWLVEKALDQVDTS